MLTRQSISDDTGIPATKILLHNGGNLREDGRLGAGVALARDRAWFFVPERYPDFIKAAQKAYFA